MTRITKKDVFLYFADKLDRARRIELEEATETDERVRRWFQELTPTEEERGRLPMPTIDVDSPEYRKLAAITYLSVEQDERDDLVSQWAAWMRNLATASNTPPDNEISPAELLEARSGTLLYREPVPMAMSDHHVPQPGIPCIYPDYEADQLIIRQTLDRIPKGVVEVLVLRRRGETEVKSFPPVRLELKRAEQLDGQPFWEKTVSLRSLIGDSQSGDDFFYCLEVAPA